MEKSRLKGRLYFYPRPPRGGRPTRTTRCPSPSNFYPRPPRGGRLSAERTSVTSIPISIHALREEGDPVGVAAVRQQIISIHALREEGDAAGTDGAQDQKHFYPRPPRGGRHISLVYPQKTALFLSTPSARRATESIGDIVHIAQFLSTPSARRATLLTPRGADVDRYFYPRPPRGGRQLSTSDMAQGRRFLSTPSARRATVNSFNVYIDGVFLSTPSARRATTAAVGYDDDYEFLSTPSARRATSANSP